MLDLDRDSATRRKFLARLQGEISRRGVVDVLRRGVKDGAHDVTLFYGTPSPGNAAAAALNAANRFTVTRQLRYSRDETKRALDLVLFINGLPVATFELKNSLTKQTVADAVEQYKRDRDPNERLFELGRCAVHFAVDEQEVRFCTHLKGKGSWFLPFNQGWNDGAGNPPNPAGLKTEYLWKRILTREGLTDILENYAQVVEFKDEKTGKKKRAQVWPRYHQLDVVRRLLVDAREHGTGRRYLIEHSAGSGKSNSIAWLAHQLIGLRKDDAPAFDSIIVVTDRQILDRQIRDTIRQFAQVGATVGHADHSGDLRRFIEGGKKIIISTVQKFPFILDEIGSEHRGRRFAIVIDEAHSSQGGRTSAAVSLALSTAGAEEDDETTEDHINRIMEARKLLPNASYFAFTATPKNKTLELFGEAYLDGDQRKHRPFHSYTMKQAIQEGFILDVLAHYTPVESYYRLVKTVEADPEFDTKRAKKKLRRFVESHDHAIRLKAEIMVDHFHEQVLAPSRIGGHGAGDGGDERHRAGDPVLPRDPRLPPGEQEPSPGDRRVLGRARVRRGEGHRGVAERFPVEPDRRQDPGGAVPLPGVRGQVPDGLRRAAAAHDVRGQDPVGDQGRADPLAPQPRAPAEARRVRARLHERHRDDRDGVRGLLPDHDPQRRNRPEQAPRPEARAGRPEVYTQGQIDDFVERYLGGADRDQLDPILDACVATYKERLDEDGQVEFKAKAKAFVRTYGFLACILPYTNAGWEKLSIFLNFLVSKLPAPKEDDLSKGILEAIDMDSYRVEKKAARRIQLADADAEIGPVPTSAGGRKPEPELDRLSNILREFNDLFGNIQWTDSDRIHRLITHDIPSRVAADLAYQNAKKNSDRQNARIEHDRALLRVMTAVLADDTQLFKEFSDNESFRRWLTERVFGLTYGSEAASGSQPSMRQGA